MKILFAAALLAASFSAQADGPTYCGAGTECTILHSGTTTFTLPSGTNTAATIFSTQTLDNKKVGLQSGSTSAPSLFFESSTNTGASLVSGNVFSIDVLGFPTMEFGSFGTATNYWLAQPGSTGVNVQLSAKGSDTNIGENFIAQNHGNFYFAADGVTQFNIDPTASAANYLQPKAAIVSSPPQLQAVGSDTNISIGLKTKGSGVTDTPTGYTAGVNGTTTGTLGLANGGGGGAYTTVQPSAVTSTTTITLPASTGTLALTTGTVTTANNVAGGAANDIVIQTGAGATGFVTPVNGALLNTNSSGVPSETATPVLGVNASVTGTLGFANGGASGATTTIQPAAVTSVATITLPNATTTLAGLGLAQTWSAAQTFSSPVSITPDSSTTPDLTFGGGTSVTNFMSFSGGRAMIGYDSGYTGGGSSGAVILAGGTGKGFEIFTGGTNGTLPSNGGAFTITSGGLVSQLDVNVTGTSVPANGLYYCSPNQLCISSNSSAAGRVDASQRLLWGYTADQGGGELFQVNSGIFANGKVTATNVLDSGLTASSAVCTDGSKNLSTTCGTTGGSGSVSATNFSPGLLTSITNTYSHFRQWTKASTVKNMIAAAMSLTCATNPTVTLYECGTSTTCASPTTLASVQVTAAGTATPATLSATAIAAGDYTAWAISAGTCTTVDVNGVAEAEQN